MILAIVVFVIAVTFFVIAHRDTTQKNIEDGEEAPMFIAEMVTTELADARHVGTTLSWIVIGFAVFMQLIAWVAAAQKLGKVKKSNCCIEDRGKHLDAIEVYFDLPLYFGLLGTVLSFILITLYPEAGLMFAYVSTGMGIIVSVILRVFYLTPYRQDLISRNDMMRD
jgi:uncharacterized membrane protein (UPF0182 family)